MGKRSRSDWERTYLLSKPKRVTWYAGHVADPCLDFLNFHVLCSWSFLDAFSHSASLRRSPRIVDPTPKRFPVQTRMEELRTHQYNALSRNPESEYWEQGIADKQQIYMHPLRRRHMFVSPQKALKAKIPRTNSRSQHDPREEANSQVSGSGKQTLSYIPCMS